MSRLRHHVQVLLRLPRAVLRGLRRPLAEPGVLLLFLLLNLGAAFVLAAPYRGLLSAELDDNLYGDAMQTGASWRWYDTVERRDPQALGDLAPWTALLSTEGVRPHDLTELSGPPAAVAVAGLILFFLHSVLHVGWLATGRWKGGRGAGVAALLHRSALFAPAALALASTAAVGYAGVYALGWVATGPPLDRLAEWAQSERLAIAFVALRLLLTGLLLAAVKILLDVARVRLVESGSGRWWGPLGRGVRELAVRGWAYLAIYAVIAAGTAALTVLWWLLSAPLVPQTWLGIVILFLLHQILLAARIGLRLAGLTAVQGTYLAAAGVTAAAAGPIEPTPAATA